jgi:hypothetical protein
MGARLTDFVPHDSKVQFGSFNRDRREAINSDPTLPGLPANRPCRGHGSIDVIDLEPAMRRQLFIAAGNLVSKGLRLQIATLSHLQFWHRLVSR